MVSDRYMNEVFKKNNNSHQKGNRLSTRSLVTVIHNQSEDGLTLSEIKNRRNPYPVQGESPSVIPFLNRGD